LYAVKKGIEEFASELAKSGKQLEIAGSAVTGYGEDLIKAAFNIDHGVVETIAHYTAAHFLNPKISFILDIGGQDMKAIFIKNGEISRVELNEACSSGCGSFVETFGKSLGYSAPDFAALACTADQPCDLGTRCTVFMNSKVKQSLRENATTADIAAGISYSVIKNCLHKVLKFSDLEELGDNIVVQGGAFKNASIQRALELITGKKVTCSKIPELMGAYGAALLSLNNEGKIKQHAK
jgi:predicted CoA-substrate-specific enzyme activase